MVNSTTMKGFFTMVMIVVHPFLFALEPSVWRDTGLIERSFSMPVQVVRYQRGANVPDSNDGPREYYVEVTPQEKKEITYIVTTLADKSHAKLLLTQGSLERAGNRVGHVHPLRFMLCIFTDEKLKVGIHNMRKKPFVWDNFISSMGESFQSESLRNNITPDMVRDFAKRLQINPDYLFHHVQQQNWNAFVDALITYVPRNEGHDRYGM